VEVHAAWAEFGLIATVMLRMKRTSLHTRRAGRAVFAPDEIDEGLSRRATELMGEHALAPRA
jgi:hypothetical protein